MEMACRFINIQYRLEPRIGGGKLASSELELNNVNEAVSILLRGNIILVKVLVLLHFYTERKMKE